MSHFVGLWLQSIRNTWISSEVRLKLRTEEKHYNAHGQRLAAEHVYLCEYEQFEL